jgi:hypothetical protein
MTALWKWVAKWYRQQFLLMAAQAHWLGAYVDLPASWSVGNADTVTVVHRFGIPQPPEKGDTQP